MHSKRSTGVDRAYFVSSVAGIHPTIAITNIPDRQSAKVCSAVHHVNLILEIFRIRVGADDVGHFNSAGVGEGPGDLMRREGQCIAYKSGAATVVDLKLVSRSINDDRRTCMRAKKQHCYSEGVQTYNIHNYCAIFYVTITSEYMQDNYGNHTGMTN